MSKLRHRSAGIIMRNGKALLMHRFKDGCEYYVFPGGGIEEGETPEETVIRELLEETQVEMRISRLVYKVSYDSGENQYYYLCEYVSGVPALRPDSIEFKRTQEGLDTYEPLWVDISKMEKLTLYPLEIRGVLVNDLAKGLAKETKEIFVRVVDIRK
jgi:8-oxo-dGTP pyrophosphatase MutT (NUDIX family)